MTLPSPSTKVAACAHCNIAGVGDHTSGVVDSYGARTPVVWGLDEPVLLDQTVPSFLRLLGPTRPKVPPAPEPFHPDES